MKKIAVLFLLVGISFLSPAVFATSVLPQSIENLYSRSQYIVKGTVTEISFDEHETLKTPVQNITVSVAEVIKGELPNPNSQKLVFTQLAHNSHSGYAKTMASALPRFEVGKTYVICLATPSVRTGLTSTIGLQQGLFELDAQDGIQAFSTRLPLLVRSSSKTQLKFAKKANDYQTLKSLFQSVAP